jgi:glucose/mannose-6-phosphate isomerase
MERSKFVIIMVRDSDDHERNKKRMNICKEIFEERVDVYEFEARGKSMLAKMFSIICFGDWVSYHLAIWKRVDPTPVYVIESLKKKMLE